MQVPLHDDIQDNIDLTSSVLLPDNLHNQVIYDAYPQSTKFHPLPCNTAQQ